MVKFFSEAKLTPKIRTHAGPRGCVELRLAGQNDSHQF